MKFRFELWRATTDPAGNCSAGSIVDTVGSSAGTGEVTHTDNSAAASTTYWYWAVSFNGAGDNGLCSDAASGTTSAPPAIYLLRLTATRSGVENKSTWHGQASRDLKSGYLPRGHQDHHGGQRQSIYLYRHHRSERQHRADLQSL